MTQLHAVQCPQCGAPIHEANPGGLITCESCSSTLQIQEGTSGFPVARLIALKQDTNFIAKREAVARLKEKLEELKADRGKTEGLMHPAEGFGAFFLPGFLLACGAVPALIGLGILLFGNAGEGLLMLTGSLAPGAIVYFVFRQLHNAKVHDLEGQYRPVVKQLDQEITERELQITRLEAELDKLTHKL